MKTIKVIDLLNKIANEEEVPKTIKYKGYKYTWSNVSKRYHDIETHLIYYEFETDELKGEVEIIEEEKEIEKIPTTRRGVDGMEIKRETNIYELRDKINELIDVVNGLPKEDK